MAIVGRLKTGDYFLSYFWVSVNWTLVYRLRYALTYILRGKFNFLAVPYRAVCGGR